MPPENLLKQRIKNGEVVVALRIPIDTERSRLEDALAKDTFHLLYVDGQHSAFRALVIVLAKRVISTLNETRNLGWRRPFFGRPAG